MRYDRWAVASKSRMEALSERFGPQAISAHDQLQRALQNEVLRRGGRTSTDDVLVGLDMALQIVCHATELREAGGKIAITLGLLAEGRLDGRTWQALDSRATISSRGKRRRRWGRWAGPSASRTC